MKLVQEVYACMRACVCACVRACVCAYVLMCMFTYVQELLSEKTALDAKLCSPLSFCVCR